jgi:hypothetical protein
MSSEACHRVHGAELETSPGPHPAASRHDKGIGQALRISAGWPLSGGIES